MAQSVQVKTVRDWHESLIDYIISNPGATLRLKAQVFGVSMSWLSILENSDSFKEAMKARRDEHFDNLSRDLVDKLGATADMLIEEINERLQKDGTSAIPFNTLKDTADMALKHLGFGAKGFGAVGGHQSAGNITNNTIIVNDKAALAEARAAMQAARNGQAFTVIEQNAQGEVEFTNLETSDVLRSSSSEEQEQVTAELPGEDVEQSKDVPE